MSSPPQYRLLEYGGNTLVVSVPQEVSPDHTAILQLAQASSSVTRAQIYKELKWAVDRTERTLQSLLQSGMAWVDTQAEDDGSGSRTRFWFPSLWQQRSSSQEEDGGGGGGGA